MMRSESLHELYMVRLRSLYSAEQQLVLALPEIKNAATSAELGQGFARHLAQTQGHVERLGQLFTALNQSPEGKTCTAMQGLIHERREAISENESGEVRDAALIAASQRIAHYEIAGYGAVVTYAELLGEEKALTLLEATLQEEWETDKSLTALARSINVEAL